MSKTYEEILIELGFVKLKNDYFAFENNRLKIRKISNENNSPKFSVSKNGGLPFYYNDFDLAVNNVVEAYHTIFKDDHKITISRSYKNGKISYSVLKIVHKDISVEPDLEQMCKELFEGVRNLDYNMENYISDKVYDLS